jgi:hypothetical protein
MVLHHPSKARQSTFEMGANGMLESNWEEKLKTGLAGNGTLLGICIAEIGIWGTSCALNILVLILFPHSLAEDVPELRCPDYGATHFNLQ